MKIFLKEERLYWGQTKTASCHPLLLMTAKRDLLHLMDEIPQSQAPVTQVRNSIRLLCHYAVLLFTMFTRLLSLLHRAHNQPGILELSGVCAISTTSESHPPPIPPTGCFLPSPGDFQQPLLSTLHLLSSWTLFYRLLLGQRNQGQPLTA